jgi:hypothetical protein
MSDTKESGTAFMRKNTPLPKSVSIDSDAFLPAGAWFGTQILPRWPETSRPPNGIFSTWRVS